MDKYINCCNCGVQAIVRKSNPYKKFCSNSCGSLFQNRIQNQKRLEDYNIDPKQCTKCNSVLPYENRKNRFCSISCSSAGNKNRLSHGKYQKKECPVCNTVTHSQYCSKKCAGIGRSKYKTDEERIHARRRMQRESYARYTAKKKYQTPVDEDLSAIKEFYKKCPDGHEVDHRIPISKGGPHSITNLQYLTISENRKKWCKIMEPPERFELS